MLKTNFSETPTAERWVLHGRLTGPWVHEFKAYWKKNHRRDVARACFVDLNEVTFIDKCGQRLLRMLARRGAQLTASGMYTKHILEQITSKTEIYMGKETKIGLDGRLPGEVVLTLLFTLFFASVVGLLLR